MTAKSEILKKLELFSLETGGLGNWLTNDTDDEVFLRLACLSSEPLKRSQLNQLLAFGHEAPVSPGFFRFYWLSLPQSHPYDVTKVPGFKKSWLNNTSIKSLAHLKWGLYRIFVDSLMRFGNVRTGYRKLRSLTEPQLQSFFSERSFDTENMEQRGLPLQMVTIAKDDRYLISEMACKSYGDHPDTPGELKQALIQAFRHHQQNGDGKAVTIKSLLEGKVVSENFEGRQQNLIFSANDLLSDSITSERDLEGKYDAVAIKFFKARESALKNTNFYLSMVGDLDVYVATSMRTRQDFREMATICETIFSSDKLKRLNIRYFDPTLSAAAGHEDKGLIECLMVKCAKVLLYCAGERDSYGKDSEAAMALSLGKPVIIYCSQPQRSVFFRDIHPLSRLIEFETGVAVGAMVTDSLDKVSDLLFRIFSNDMGYRLEHPKKNYLRLREVITNSIVRLQTSDRMLSETFWNYYHESQDRPDISCGQKSSR